MINLFLMFLCAMLYKFFANFYYKYKTEEYMGDYREWIKNGTNPEKVFKDSAHLKGLIAKANIEDMHFNASEPVGYGYISTCQASVLFNHPIKRSPFSEKMHEIMLRALGAYEQRMKDAFNPLYWINFVLYLPREITKYLGAPYGAIPKTLQILWWIITGISTIALSLYPEIFRTTIEKLLYTLP